MGTSSLAQNVQSQECHLLFPVFVILLSLHLVPCEAVWPFSSEARIERAVLPRSPKSLFTQSQRSLPHFEVDGGKGKELAEQYARQNGLIESGNDCRQEAYAELQRSCREIMQLADLRHRLAIRFANCFAAESGKPTFPCTDGKSIKDCTAPMDDLAHGSYRSFFIHVDAVCHHLQSEYFTQRTETIVNRLVESSHRTAEQLTSVSSKSEAILERADKSLALQRALEERQEGFRVLLEGSMGDISAATGRIREGVDDVITRQEAAGRRQEEIARDHAQVMGRLEVQTERVSDGVSKSLEGQGELLKGQAEAAEKLGALKEEQERAFRAHTERLMELSGIAARHAKEVAEFQTGMEAAQERLASGSEKILEQQASFASKQAAVFSSLDRMFTLYGTIVSESMALKSLLFYAAVVTIAYVLTATKRTQNARFWLYCGLTANFAVECGLLRYFNPAEEAAAISAGIRLTRSAFALYSFVVLLVSFLSYRDYAALSYSLLEAQTAKLAVIEQRLLQPSPLPPDFQLSLGANQEAPRQLSAPPENDLGLDLAAYRAVARAWSEERNAQSSSSDESYAPERGWERLDLRRGEGYTMRQRPRPTWSRGQEILERESVDDFALVMHAKSLYHKYVSDLVSESGASTSESKASESYCNSQQLDEALADEASSHGPETSSYGLVGTVLEPPKPARELRRGRRRSVAC